MPFRSGPNRALIQVSSAGWIDRSGFYKCHHARRASLRRGTAGGGSASKSAGGMAGARGVAAIRGQNIAGRRQHRRSLGQNRFTQRRGGAADRSNGRVSCGDRGISSPHSGDARCFGFSTTQSGAQSVELDTVPAQGPDIGERGAHAFPPAFVTTNEYMTANAMHGWRRRR